MDLNDQASKLDNSPEEEQARDGGLKYRGLLHITAVSAAFEVLRIYIVK